MHPIQTQIIVIAGLVLILLPSGLWLTRTGKPYGTIVFTIHKLAALGAIILLAAADYSANRSAPLGPSAWIVSVAAILFFVATMVFGGLVSIDAAGGFSGVAAPIRSAFLAAHRILPFIAFLGAALSVYLVFF